MERNRGLLKNLAGSFNLDDVVKNYGNLDSTQQFTIAKIADVFGKRLGLSEEETNMMLGKLRSYAQQAAQKGLSSQQIIDSFFSAQSKGENKSFDKSVADANQMLGEIVQQVKNVGQALLVSVGVPLMQIIQPVLAGMAKSIKWIGGFISENMTLFKGIGYAISAGLAAAAIVLVPLTVKVIAIGAALMYVVKKWDEFKNGTLDTNTVVGALFNLLFKIGGFLFKLSSGPLKLVSMAFEGIWMILKGVWSVLETLGGYVAGPLIQALNGMSAAFDIISSAVEKIWSGISSVGDLLTNSLTGVMDKVFTTPTESFLSALKMVMPMLAPVISLAEKIFGKSLPGSVATSSPTGSKTATSSPSAAVSGGVLDYIKQAAAMTGVNQDYLLKTAFRESSFNPNAKAPKGSAEGLFQFIDSTWLSTMKKYGSQAGVAPGLDDKSLLAMKKDPRMNAMMGAFLAKENQNAIGSSKQGDMYLAHFLGADAARKVIEGQSLQSALGNKYATAMANNPFMQGMSSADLRNWAEKKMTETSGYKTALNDLRKVQDIRNQSLNSQTPIKVVVDHNNDQAAKLLAEQNDFLAKQEKVRAANLEEERIARALRGQNSLTEELNNGSI
jgi:hypothetical protein